MINSMILALEEKKIAELEFNAAKTESEIDIAIHTLAIAELKISRIIKLAKGEVFV